MVPELYCQPEPLYCPAKPKQRNSKKVNFTGERFLNSISCDYHHYHKIRHSDRYFDMIFLYNYLCEIYNSCLKASSYVYFVCVTF